MSNETYLLRWRGRQDGPYALETLRDKLAAGQIGLMHEIYVNNQWLTLNEFLQGLDSQKKADQTARDQAAQQERQRHEAARQEFALQETQRQNDLLAEQIDAMRRDEEKRAQMPSYQAQNPAPPSGYPSPTNAPYRGTSGMAITAFVCSLLNFVPFLNFLSWILAIVFGHIALSEIKRTPGLGGQGLATAALAITYGLLFLGLIVGLILGLTGYLQAIEGVQLDGN